MGATLWTVLNKSPFRNFNWKTEKQFSRRNTKIRLSTWKKECESSARKNELRVCVCMRGHVLMHCTNYNLENSMLCCCCSLKICYCDCYYLRWFVFVAAAVLFVWNCYCCRLCLFSNGFAYLHFVHRLIDNQLKFKWICGSFFVVLASTFQ